MAQRFKVRPSELLDVDDPYAAFCFDDACSLWGLYVEHTVSEAGSSTTNQAQREMIQSSTMKRILQGPDADEVKTPAAKFRDPAELFKK